MICLGFLVCGCGGGSSSGGGHAPVSRFYDGAPFSIIVLPDTQMYSHLYPDIFTRQTQWIKDNVQAHEIAFVLHEGDIVNIPGPGTRQWENAARSMSILDGVVPYAIVPGNHDYDDQGKTRATTMFNRFFPIDKYRHNSSFGGAYEQDKMDNTFHLFNAGNTNWLVLCLEFGPRDAVLEWASQVIIKYPNRRVILLTHSYLEFDSNLSGADPTHSSTPSKMGIASQPGGTNDGKQVWDKFVSQHRNIQFVFSGHTPGDGTGRRTGYGKHRNPVYEMVANYQYGENGGNGYLRIIRFEPSKASVTVSTYSPWLGEFLTDAENQFVYHGVEFDSP